MYVSFYLHLSKYNDSHPLCYIIVFTWSRYDGDNIETKTLAGLPPKAKKPTIEGGGDFLTWIPSINYPDPKVPI